MFYYWVKSILQENVQQTMTLCEPESAYIITLLYQFIGLS